MANIKPWYTAGRINPETGEAYKLQFITLDWTKDRDALTLRAARPSDAADQIFDPTAVSGDLGDLWLTLKASKHNVSANNLWLFGDEIDPETGKAFMVQGAIPSPKNPEYAHAYSAKQVAAFEPRFFFMMRGQFSQPILSASLLPYVAKKRGRASTGLPKPAIVRMTSAPATPPVPPRQRRGQ